MSRGSYGILVKVQVGIVVVAAVFATFLGTRSQRGGIDPLTAAFCPPLGLWSLVFGPNHKGLSEWETTQWALALSSTALLVGSNRVAWRARRTSVINVSVFACVVAAIWWSVLGLARVGYSMG